jgi:lysophospholipase L1-like esterase
VAVLAGLVLLVAVVSVAAHRMQLVGAGQAPTGKPTPANVPPVRIMPLGDSLTDGENIPGGYRIELWSRLVADGLPVDFVGSQSNGPASLPDRDHEGHPGWRIDQIAGAAGPWLTRYQPQIVLLLIGTNDVVQDANLDAAPGRLGALIDQITATLPNCRVIVASIPRLRDRVWRQRAETYNVAIPAIVSTRGSRVAYVDAYSVLDDSDLIGDGIHLTAGGDRKLADAWYPVIRCQVSALNGEGDTRC